MWVTMTHPAWHNDVEILSNSSLRSGNVGLVLRMQDVKAATRDDINFRFYFRTEVVYPTDHKFIFFRIFIFL